MADSENPSEQFRVADLSIDVGQQSVLRDGQPIALPNLSFKLLLVLTRAAPNFLDNEELMRRVWPGLVVSPETVSKRVALLREALGDDPKQPRYIEGLRSRGYRIIAAASVVPLPAALAEPPATPALVDRLDAARGARPQRARVRWTVAVPIALALAAFLAVIGERRHAVPSLPAASPVSPVSVDEHARTVAVLPFDNISASPNDAYLALGVPDILINRLSSTPELLTIARSSSFAIAAQRLDPTAIGERLRAGYLIEGSVQREGEHLRIAVELIESASGKLLWSDRFDRRVRDILEVEDEIGDHVTKTLLGRVAAAPVARLAAERSANVEAYLEFLRGRSLLGRFSVSETDAAIPFLEHAIQLDPHFAAAHALLYDAKMQAAAGRYEDLAPLRNRYRSLIDDALRIDPNSGTAYFARALWGVPGDAAREADFIRGMRLDPSNGRGLTAYAEYLEWELERPTDAANILKQALEVDPMSPRVHFFEAASSLYSSGVQVLEEKMRQVLELDPNFVPALQRYGKYQWQLHANLAVALQFEEHALALDPHNPWLRHTTMAIYLDLEEPEAAREVSAGATQSAAGASLLLDLYRGDWRGAGLAAGRGQPVWKYNVNESWGASEALRDYALRTGKLDPALALLEDTYGLSTDPAQPLNVNNYREAVYLSQLLSAQGHGSQATALRHTAAAWNDANEPKYGSFRARRLRAAIQLLDGHQDAALAELAESFRMGDYTLWWYTLRQDPLWEPLHGHPRFLALERTVSQHVAQERAAVERLIAQGLIPRRPHHAGGADAVTSR